MKRIGKIKLIIVLGMLVGISLCTVMIAEALGAETKLTASDAAALDHFGYSVAISGDTAIVGAHQENTAAGAAYVFVWNEMSSSWTQQAKLTASDAAPYDRFGSSVAISGDTAIVGALHDDDACAGDPNCNSGAAYVFMRTGTTWTEQAKLTASDAAARDYFGWSVAISGDTAIVGAPFDDDACGSNPECNSGSAYVFLRDEMSSSWTEQTKLTASDDEERDLFGFSVAISGDTAVVGAHQDDDACDSDPLCNSGAAYVFLWDEMSSSWTEQTKLTADDGARSDWLGYSVAISGDTAIVGAPRDDDATGSAYVFIWDETDWIQHKLTADDGAPFEWFGYSVAISGDTAIAGAYGSDDACISDLECDSGSAYVFVRSGSSWVQQDKLTADDAAPGDAFGQSVAISGDTAIVGAPYADDACVSDPPCNSGAAYVYEPTPEEQIEGILEFFDESVEGGTLFGNGSGKSAEGRLGALRNKVEEAEDRAARGDIEGACQKLLNAYRFCDDLPRPLDFVQGPAVAALREMILDVMEDLGCELP